MTKVAPVVTRALASKVRRDFEAESTSLPASRDLRDTTPVEGPQSPEAVAPPAARIVYSPEGIPRFVDEEADAVRSAEATRVEEPNLGLILRSKLTLRAKTPK